jgi:hypothetical protein
MSQELALKWWPWGKKSDDSPAKRQNDIDETLDRIARVREQVDADLVKLQAAVNGEDLWFKCFQVTQDHQERGS